MIARAIVLVFLLAGTAQAADVYCVEKNAQAQDGAIQLARQWERVFSDGFETGLDNWKTENYEKKLEIGLSDQGRTGKCLQVTNGNAKGDTAFEVTSRPVPVRAGEGYRFECHWRSSLGLTNLAGHKGHYMTQLQWLDEAGSTCDQTPFSFGKAEKYWQVAGLSGRAPDKARSVVIRIGFDNPNVTPGNSFMLDDVALDLLKEPAAYAPFGLMVSRPLLVMNDDWQVSWQADLPAGTSVRLQVAAAPEEGGGPGDWSKPVGPDGTEKSFLTEPGLLPSALRGRPWVRYTAFLETADPAKTPALKCVTIGGLTDGPWQGLDTNPPAVTERSPTRTADAKAPIRFRLADESGVDRRTLRVALDDADITGQTAFAEGRYVYDLPKPLAPPPVFDKLRAARGGEGINLHRISVRAADFAGNVLDRTWYLLIRPPRTQGLVALRDDGMTLVDGKPFFPIGLYAVWKKPFNEDSFDKAFADIKAAGFNMAHTYNSGRGPDFAEFYAAAQRHGIKLYVASGAGANCTDTDTVLWDVAREEAQPALLAWYLADDTASHVGCDELRAVSEGIHDIDPAHITVQADGVGAPPISRYTRYVASTDGFLPELYPIRDNSDKGVPQIIADMKTIQGDLAKAGTRRKAIWAIVQYFQGWGWPRYPTRQELWAMSYLSIIHGANGITWYTYGGHGNNHGVTDNQEVWKNICDLAGELSKLRDVLVEPTGALPSPPTILSGPERDALGYPSISFLLKEHAGKRWLLTANSSSGTVSVQFPIPKGRRLDLPFEGRQPQWTEGGFTDTFVPYGVHVYLIE